MNDKLASRERGMSEGGLGSVGPQKQRQCYFDLVGQHFVRGYEEIDITRIGKRTDPQQDNHL